MLLEILSLFLYSVQQLGVMLGVGAQTILLFLYLIAARDGTIDDKEQHFLHATKRIIYFGLVCIVLSGIAITVLHMGEGQGGIIFSPAYLFKWLLIAIAIILAAVDYKDTVSLAVRKGLSGGTWLALFAVHILAPITTWLTLGILYAVWMIIFMTVWLLLAYVLQSLNIRGSRPTSVAAPAQPAKPYVPANVEPPPPPKPTPVPIPTKPHIHVQPLPPPRTIPPPQPAPVFSIPKPATVSPLATSSAEPLALHPHMNERAASLPPAPPPPKVGEGSPALATANVTLGLPAMRIMPQKKEDLDTQHRAPLVRFG